MRVITEFGFGSTTADFTHDTALAVQLDTPWLGRREMHLERYRQVFPFSYW